MPLERTLDGALGFEMLEVGPDRAHGRVVVTDRLRHPGGLVHGGVYAALAESLASQATHAAVRERGLVAVGLSNHTSLLRPVADGSIAADAHPRHRGRTTWLWEVDHADDQGRLCAVSRVTVAVRPAAAPDEPPVSG